MPIHYLSTTQGHHINFITENSKTTKKLPILISESFSGFPGLIMNQNTQSFVFITFRQGPIYIVHNIIPLPIYRKH